MSEDQCATKCYSMTVFNLFDITVSGQKGFVLCSESVRQIDKLCPVGLDKIKKDGRRMSSLLTYPG